MPVDFTTLRRAAFSGVSLSVWELFTTDNTGLIVLPILAVASLATVYFIFRWYFFTAHRAVTHLTSPKTKCNLLNF